MAGVRLTQDEFTHLIRLATGDRALPVQFGPGWIELDPAVAFGAWAMRELEVLRDV